MRLVVQRVSRAQVRVAEQVVGEIAHGLLVLLGAEKGDDGETAEEAARRVAALRIFEDQDGKMNRSLGEAGGSVLVVSQFTLAADLSRGRRPGFEKALPPAEAKVLYEHFARTLEILGFTVATGSFGQWMEVELVNAGPATFVLEFATTKPNPESA